MFPGLGTAISAVGQARAFARQAKQKREINEEMMQEMLKTQALAYDAERYPHFIDLPRAD